MKTRCPNCGYCDKCGRADTYPYRPTYPPYSPWRYPPFYWHYGQPYVTWSSGQTSSNQQMGETYNLSNQVSL